MEVAIHANSSGDTLHAGDVLCAVARFSPNNTNETFNVNPSFKGDSSFLIDSMSVNDDHMNFSFNFDGGTFNDTASGESISL